MNNPLQTHGAFSWYELNSANVKASKNFYANVLGWQFDETKMQNGEPYYLIKVNNQEIGGMMNMPQSNDKQWSPYITVKDVDKVVEKARALGAKIGEIIQMKGVGRFCSITDPQGTTFSVISYDPN